ncbi:hypothetical protein H632_c487p2 [Helicosporidium sp. ATCC 50920]|nr:hypothetical protein H632_c487p2 [Helicosporidium sp. ATCC 50920]|eukprot:KDD75818.1 hypothetical protein H632_c487p2 [Helicosporidium sp. ATCC 50920]
MRRVERESRDGGGGLAFTTRAADKTQLFSFAGSSTLAQNSSDAATRALETETERRQAGGPRADAGDESLAEGSTYTGLAGYRDWRAGFRQESVSTSTPGSGSFGPQRTSTNVRMTVRVDYQPDVCKDYKETGYCGYGDACKFLHDRGDYKAGYELDRDWAPSLAADRVEQAADAWDVDASLDAHAARQRGERGEGAAAAQPEDDEVPFACFSCRLPWRECRDPVTTLCGHYFCEQCALKAEATTGKCGACGEATRGIFNVAHDVLRRLAREGSAGEKKEEEDAGGWDAVQEEEEEGGQETAAR